MTETDQEGAAYREVEADLEVLDRQVVADGVVTLALADPAGADLPEWTPGAHIDLQLTPSLVRQYSLCGSTSNRAEWHVGVLLDPESRGGSQFIHDELRKGSTVRVRGPRNHFPLVSSRRYQFIAGGIGITPILTMIEAAEARDADWQLLYGGRERASMAFVDHLGQYGDRVTVWPQGGQGMLDLDSLLSEPRDDTLVYCCGPEGLLGAVEEACQPWTEGSLHVERFAAKPPSDEPSPGGLESFEVECQQSGVVVSVPADRSIYEAVEEAGVAVLGSCMEGVCGTCECDVIEGEPDHRDSVLSEAERGGRHDHGLRFAVALGKAGAGHMRPNYPFNCWYVAATSDEVGEGLLGRRLLGIPVVLYRRGSGDVVAMEDRCIHRAYPLSAGRLEGDRLVCGYHDSRTTPTAPASKCLPRRTSPEAPAFGRSRSASSRRSCGSGSASRE